MPKKNFFSSLGISLAVKIGGKRFLPLLKTDFGRAPRPLST
jgi:hypothetical protein